MGEDKALRVKQYSETMRKEIVRLRIPVVSPNPGSFGVIIAESQRMTAALFR